MNRRKFLQYSASSGVFVVSLGLLTPQRADSFLFALLLRGTLMDLALGALSQGAFALARSAFSRRSQEWYDKRLQAQLAQREFVRRQFGTIETAQVSDHQYNYISASQFREQLGYNVVLSFPETRLADASHFAGPATIGMAIAARYLREHHRMEAQDVRAAIFPREKLADNWRTWEEPNSFTRYDNQVAGNGVLIRYDAVKPAQGGYGLIQVSVNSSSRIRVPDIKVNYI